MQALTIEQDLACDLEFTELRAWVDLLSAVPRSFADEFGLAVHRVSEAVVCSAKGIPLPLFNRALGLGLAKPVNRAQLDRVLEFARAAPGRFLVHWVPGARPEFLPRLLADRGLYPRGGWDRMCRRCDAPDLPCARLDLGAPPEAVTEATAEEWAVFVSASYGLPRWPWLQSLALRPGWTHLFVRRGGAMVAARSMYARPDGKAWLGLDAPVPGVNASTYEEDAALCRELVRRGTAGGARCFVADVETPGSDPTGPAYARFASLGFRRAYRRTDFAR